MSQGSESRPDDDPEEVRRRAEYDKKRKEGKKEPEVVESQSNPGSKGTTTPDNQ